MELRHYERIIGHTDRDPSTGCLVSRYSVGSHGYAQAWNGITVILAHRFVWETINGPIPEGMTVDHVCHNRKCIEIDHLRLLSNLENARMNNAHLTNKEPGKCVHGHEDALYWHPKSATNKKGYCHACAMERQRARRKMIRVNPG